MASSARPNAIRCDPSARSVPGNLFNDLFAFAMSPRTTASNAAAAPSSDSSSLASSSAASRSPASAWRASSLLGSSPPAFLRTVLPSTIAARRRLCAMNSPAFSSHS